MRNRRRKTDGLHDTPLPSAPAERAASVARELQEQMRYLAAAAVEVEADGSARPMKVFGRIEVISQSVLGAAVEAVDLGHPAAIQTLVMPGGFGTFKCAVIRCGQQGLSEYVVVICDETLSRRDVDAIASWATGAREGDTVRSGGPCGSVARDVAAKTGADVVTIALFAPSGMLMNLHVRSGSRLRAWRTSTETVWAEAALHKAAFLLGDLELHPGAEHLAALGMQSAAVVALENRKGVPIGSVGIASRAAINQGDVDVLMNVAPEIAEQIVALRTTDRRMSNVGALEPHGERRGVQGVEASSDTIDLALFARLVACRRFSVYVRTGNMMQMVSAFREDGTFVMDQPDPMEHELVRWAAERGLAVANQLAAAVMVGDGTVLYARDDSYQPMQRLRSALLQIRDLTEGGRPPEIDFGDHGREAA